MYYNIEGVMEFPDSMTKKDMNDIYDEYGDFIEDNEIDYFGFLSNMFRICVSFEVQADSLMRALGLIKKYNGTITEIRCDDHMPDEPYRMKGFYSELLDMYDKGKDAVIELMKQMIDEHYPDVEYMEDEGIFWIEKE